MSKNKKVDSKTTKLKSFKSKPNFVKVGTKNNNLQKHDILAGGWKSKNEIPQKYWNEISNPDYDPNEEGSQEFIYVNEYEKDLDGGVPGSGSYEFGVNGKWLAISHESFGLDKFAKMAKMVVRKEVKSIIDNYKEKNNLRVCFDTVEDCVKNLTSKNYIYKKFCNDIIDYDIQLNVFVQNLINDIENGTVANIPDLDELIVMFPAYTGV